MSTAPTAPTSSQAITPVDDSSAGLLAPAADGGAAATARAEMFLGPQLGRYLGWTARTASVLVAVIGAAAMLGWIARIELLKSAMYGATPMNPLTALAFIASAVALWLLTQEHGRPRAWWAGHLLAVAILGVGLARLFQVHFVGLDPLDRILFASQLGNNRMATNTATAFVLYGAALLLFETRIGRVHVAQALVLALGAVSLLAITGYLYHVLAFYHVTGRIPMALNSAIAFVLLTIGTLAARPDREPVATLSSRTTGGITARRLLPAAFGLPLVLGWLRLQGQRMDYYDTEFGLSLFVMGIILVFNALVWWNARTLHRSDQGRSEVERGLREAEAIYHSLVETLPQNIFRKNLLGQFTFANRNFCVTLKRPLDQIVGHTDLDFYPPELAQRYRQDDKDVIESGRIMDHVEEHITATGSKLYVQVMKTPVYGPGGAIVGTQGIFWDVTDRKLAEQELQQKNRQLEEAARSERLAHVALQQAHEDLKRAQTRLVQSEKLVGLGQMVAGVAHEINNPLAFVTNNVAVLQRDVKGIVDLLVLYRDADTHLREQRPDLAQRIGELAEQIDVTYTIENLGELLGRSKEGLRRIQQIVKDLRDFARLDESDLHDVDINDGIESTINIVKGHARKKQVELVRELSSLPRVTCYPAKVNQVIMNLITNAIDASPEGGKVVVRTSQADVASAEDGMGPAVRVQVIDQGSGIDPAVRQRIFDPFFTTKPPGHGTGLGLSISYGIIQDHGGSIDVESFPGKGATFTVILPLRPPTSMKEGEEMNEPPADESA